MKLTFLGTGTSTGVPSIGCDCDTCVSDDPRDKRLRVSILIEHAGRSILVDTSIDFRQQALRANIRHLDAVLITHCHVDHVFGLDDIRPLNFRYGAMGVYANEIAWTDLRRIFQYIFKPTHFGGGHGHGPGGGHRHRACVLRGRSGRNRPTPRWHPGRPRPNPASIRGHLHEDPGTYAMAPGLH